MTVGVPAMVAGEPEAGDGAMSTMPVPDNEVPGREPVLPGMPGAATAVQLESPRGFPLPPSHRLFAVFDDPRLARNAIRWLQAKGMDRPGDIWSFYGPDGRSRLHGERNRLRTAVFRLVQIAMSNDAYYLSVLDDAIDAGAMVLAIRVTGEVAADRLATELVAWEAHSFAYGAHWDYLPVTAAA